MCFKTLTDKYLKEPVSLYKRHESEPKPSKVILPNDINQYYAYYYLVVLEWFSTLDGCILELFGNF